MAVPVIHKITLWAANGKNAYAETQFDEPVEVTAFWIDGQAKAQDAEGVEFVSLAKILSPTKLFELGDRVQFEELANANIDNSFVVKRTMFVENRLQTTKLYTALLGATGNGRG